MKKISIVFLFTILLISICHVDTRAEVLNLTGIPLQDNFIEFCQRYSHQGTISVLIVDDTPRWQASLQSKLPLTCAVNIFNAYLADHGIKGKMTRCPYCPLPQQKYTWSGNLSGQKRDIAIDYYGTSEDIIISAYSDVEQNSLPLLPLSFTSSFPEFLRLAGRPQTKYETVTAGSLSALFIYEIASSPQHAANSAVRGLTTAGWELLQNQVVNVRENDYVALLNKDNYRASVISAGESLIVNVAPYRQEL